MADDAPRERQGERGGKEGDKGPEVEHLGEVQGGDVVGLVAKHDAAVPRDEARKEREERQVRPHAAEDGGGVARDGDDDADDGDEDV